MSLKYKNITALDECFKGKTKEKCGLSRTK